MPGQITQQMVAIASGRFGSPNAYGNGVGTFQRGDDLYIVCSNPGFGQGTWLNDDVDGQPPTVLAQAHVLKSQDNGATWFEVDENNGPQVSLLKSATVFRGLTSPIAATYQDANTLIVAYWVWNYVYNTAPTLRFSTFDLSTDTWGAETAGGPASTIVANQPLLNISIARRASDGAIVFLYDGYETVGANHSRMFYLIYNAGWGAETPLDAAQTGSTDDYNMGGAVAGDLSRTHLFYRTDVGGTSNLLQSTLTSADVLTAPVAITSLVLDNGPSNVPPGPAPWGTPVARVVAGVTSIFIPYVKSGTLELNFQHAVSANSPGFTEVLIGSVNCMLAGIFDCGNPISLGLAATTKENTTDLVVTGSQDVTTWEATQPVTVPPPTDPSLRNFFGLGISAGATGFQSAGIVVNALFSPPE